LKNTLIGLAFVAGLVLLAEAQITLESKFANADPGQTSIEGHGRIAAP
jgi:hypothetical protein